jgi:hypothetical protein
MRLLTRLFGPYRRHRLRSKAGRTTTFWGVRIAHWEDPDGIFAASVFRTEDARYVVSCSMAKGELGPHTLDTPTSVMQWLDAPLSVVAIPGVQAHLKEQLANDSEFDILIPLYP